MTDKDKAISLQDTLGNLEWLSENEAAIREMLPETWTHILNLNGPKLGFKLKLLGVDWRSQDEFGRVMVYLEKIGMMLRDGHTVRRNQHSIFRSDRP